MRRVGLVMPMGKITAVQANSPAAGAGLKAGDVITQWNGQPVGDAMTFANRLRVLARGAEEVTLAVQREGSSSPLQLRVPLRKAEMYDVPLLPGNPMSAPSWESPTRFLPRCKPCCPDRPPRKPASRQATFWSRPGCSFLSPRAWKTRR